MKKLLIILLLIVGCVKGETGIYISPGIQIGFNSNHRFFYGYQISFGKELDYKQYSDVFITSSICYGYKRYFNSKMKEIFLDIQMSVVPDPMYGDGVLRWDDIPIGLGVGMNRSNGKSNMRIKAYTWLFSCITIDYEIKTRVHNISLIPVLPIFPDS